MTVKEYFRQAYRLEQRVNSKLEMLETLKQLATKCTATASGMPSGSNQNTSTMADTIEKIVDLKDEISMDINKLVDLKREMISIIKSVKNLEYQLLLELRYLCDHTWEQIAEEMNYGESWIFTMHKKALKVAENLYKLKVCSKMQ